MLGLDQVAETTKQLPNLGGGKKVVYTHRKFPLTEVDKLSEISDNKLKEGLGPILEKHGHLWSRRSRSILFRKRSKDLKGRVLWQRKQR